MFWELSQDNLQQIGVLESVFIGCCGWLGKGGGFNRKFLEPKKIFTNHKKTWRGKVPGKREIGFGRWCFWLICEGIFYRNPTKMTEAHALPSPFPRRSGACVLEKKWFPPLPKNGPFRGLCLRATVLDRFRVEITTSKKEFFQADASGGHLVLSIRGEKTEPIPGGCWFFGGMEMGCDAKCVNRPRWAEVLIVSELNFLGDGQLNLWWELVWVKGNKTWGCPW